MKKFSTFFAFMALTLSGFAQSNPVPFALTSGAYVFNNWPAESPAGTYPEGMIFHTYAADMTHPELDAPLTGDWACAYNLTSRARIIGEGENGFSFLNTGDVQDTETRCQGGDGVTGGFVGAAVVALNTEGHENISGSFIATKMTAGSNDIPREYRIRAEYRVGTSGDFVFLEGTEMSSAVVDLDDPQDVSFTLPADADNQAVVQIRIKYYQHAQNDGGQRPQWRVGSFIAAGDFTSSTSHASAKSKLEAYPNPSSDGIFKLNSTVDATIFDITGKQIERVLHTSSISLSAYMPGIYLLRTDAGDVLRLLKN